MTRHLQTAGTAIGAALLVGMTTVTWARHDATAAQQGAAPVRDGHVTTYWPGGILKSDVSYRNDAYEGEYRTFYASGAPYELRHYTGGREEGRQQSWAADGTIYLNYEVRGGRRYGLVNASPCSTVGGGSAQAGVPERTEPEPDTWGFGANAAQSRRDSTSVDERRDNSGLPYYDESTFTPHWAPVAHTVAPFSLVTESRAPISDRTLAGRPYVASFVYTSCAAVCPILVRQLSRVQTDLGDLARIVSFTVTPDTDTPAVLASFGRARGIDPRRWSLVTGSRRTIYTLARTSYFADDDRTGFAPDDDRAFLHSEKLLLVDGSGQLRGVYNGTQPFAVDQLIADFRALTDDKRSR